MKFKKHQMLSTAVQRVKLNINYQTQLYFYSISS